MWKRSQAKGSMAGGWKHKQIWEKDVGCFRWENIPVSFFLWGTREKSKAKVPFDQASFFQMSVLSLFPVSEILLLFQFPFC